MWSTEDLIFANGGTSTFVSADLGNTEDVAGVVPGAVSAFGRVDILVNCAATYVGKALLETTDEEWERVQRVNVNGVFGLCRSSVQQMIDQDRLGREVAGRIVNIGSQHGIVAAPKDIAYGTSKSAMMYLSRQIAVDYAKDGIVCNNVAPGKIYTGKGGRELEAEWQELWKSKTPWPRSGEVEDVARAALFFASDDSTFTTGATLMVDGGWSAA